MFWIRWWGRFEEEALELPAVPRDWSEALDPGGLVLSGVGWRSISRLSMVSTYVMFVGGA